jgi:hypothetical protein
MLNVNRASSQPLFLFIYCFAGPTKAQPILTHLFLALIDLLFMNTNMHDIIYEY